MEGLLRKHDARRCLQLGKLKRLDAQMVGLLAPGQGFRSELI